MGDALLVTKLRVESECVEIVFGKVAASHFKFKQIQTCFIGSSNKTTVCFLVADRTVSREFRVWHVVDGV